MKSRPPSRPKPLSETIREESPGLSRLLKQAEALSRLDLAIRAGLPEAIADNVRLARLDRERVVFLTRSSLLAARLRTLQTSLLQHVHAVTGTRVNQLVVKVSPSLFAPDAQQMGKPLSDAASRALRAAADSMSDPELRAQFLDLAGKAKP